MTIRERWSHAPLLIGASAALLLADLLISRDQWLIPFALIVGIALAVGAFVTATFMLLVVTIAAFLQPPLGDVAGLSALQLSEVAIPVLLLVLAVKPKPRDAPVGTAHRGLPSSVQAIHLAVVLYAVVIGLNFIRSTFFLTTATTTYRTFYAYFVALGMYLIIYMGLRRGEFSLSTLFRILLILSAIMSAIGVFAVVFGLPLNFGDLRYSVYDYGSGAVRVGFLETFGTAGLALAVVGMSRWPIASGALFAAAVFASGGRAAAVGILVGIAAYMLVTRRVWLLVAIASVAVVTAFAFPTIGANPQIQRFSQLGGQTFQQEGRSFIYSASLHSFAQQPLFGTGVGVGYSVFDPDPLRSTFLASQLELGGHATYAAVLKNFGLVGFIPFAAAMLIALGALARRARSSPPAGFFLIFLTAEMVSMIAGGNGSNPEYFFVLGGAVALLAATARSASAQQRSRASTSDGSASTGLPLAVGAVEP